MIQPNNEKLPELFAALAKAQGAFAPIAKNRSVTIQPREGRPYHFKYADLEAIIAATRPALAANGLSMFQPVSEFDGRTVLFTVIAHNSGASLVSEFAIPKIGDRDPKQYGATLTYLRRYMATSMLGVAADDDLDENGNHGDLETGAAPAKEPARVARKDKPTGETASAPAAAPAATKADTTSASTATVGAGEVAYLTKKAATVDVDLTQLAADVGLNGIVIEAGKLSKNDFDTLKVELMKRGA